VAGNGYFAEGQYQPKSTETWASLSAGWDTYTSWSFTPDLPLTFTTGVVDFGRKELLNPLIEISANHPVTTTIYYGDTVDSSGGSIDSPSSVTVTPQTSVSSINARYFQFAVSIDYGDSSGIGPIPNLSSLRTDLSARLTQITKDSIDSSTLGGSLGARELTVDDLAGVKTAVVTPHATQDTYVATGYVASGYVATGTLSLPHITLDKTTDPITLVIRDLNTYGKTTIECVFDAIIEGLPTIESDANGNIRET
jgi:hypothetical protein